MSVEPLVERFLGSSPEVSARADEVAERTVPDLFDWSADALRRRMLALADLVSALLFSALFAWTQHLGVRSMLELVALLPLWLLVAKLAGLYDKDHRTLRHLTADELPALLIWAVAGSALVSLVVQENGSILSISILPLVAALFATVVCLRSLARALWRVTVPPAQVVVVGTGLLAAATKRKLELFRDIHAAVTAELSIDDARALLRRGGDLAPGRIDRVIIASGSPSNPVMDELLALCRSRGMKLSLLQPLRGHFGCVVSSTRVGELAAIEYNTFDVSRSTLLLKRLLDVTVALLGLILLLPLFIAIAIAISVGDRGPVLFKQRRAGAGGRSFTIWKFRTMGVDAEDRLPELVQFDGLEHPVFKLPGDPRVTRVGRLLRRFSLDELPQLVNVLLGEMSLVGSRPEQVELVERYTAEQRLRLSLKPGLTGPMQIYGRGELSLDERLAVELDYIDNLSLGRDLRILVHTLGPVLTGHGAS